MKQLGLFENNKPKRGGAREGAGRKRIPNRHDPDHRTRPEHKKRFPLHVVYRTRADVPRLRRGKILEAIRRALVVIARRLDFRVPHVSIQHNHLHLLVEAANEAVLSEGMQAFAISAARAINRMFGRSGKVFAYRYHATELKNPRQTRNALSYVLNNWRRHREDRGADRGKMIDRYSSGISFVGWRGVASFSIPEGYEPLPVSAPKTWLLREGWLVHGELDPYAVPGKL